MLNFYFELSEVEGLSVFHIIYFQECIEIFQLVQKMEGTKKKWEAKAANVPPCCRNPKLRQILRAVS